MKTKNLIFLHGENTLSVLKAVRQICASFARKHSENEIIQLDWESADTNLLDATLFANPLFANKRLIKLRNFLGNSPFGEQTLEKIKRLPQSSVVLFYETKPLDKRKKIFRQIQSLAGINKNFPLPKPHQLNRYIKNLAQERGLEIEPAALDALEVAIGNNPLLLDRELEKLSHLNKRIEVRDVAQNVGNAIEYSFFDVIDLIVANRPKEAWRKVDRLLLAGQSPWILFANFVGVLQGAYLLSAQQTNRPLYSLAKQAGLNAFFLSKILPFAQKWRPKQLLGKIKTLLELDQNMKTGKIEAGVAVDIAIANMF